MPTILDGATYLSHAATSAPASEPVTVAEAKAHSNIDHSLDDTLIAAQLIAAREYVEALIKSPLMQRTCRLRLDQFPIGNAVMLPAYPVQSVTSVQYVDTAGATQTLASAAYSLDTDAATARITLNRGYNWPGVGVEYGVWGAQVTYVAGYALAADVPQTLKQAILLVFGHWYDNARETALAENLREAPHAVDALCKTFVRTRWFA
jgi:uncharacterized phiE125 gp8 family phage protein